MRRYREFFRWACIALLWFAVGAFYSRQGSLEDSVEGMRETVEEVNRRLSDREAEMSYYGWKKGGTRADPRTELQFRRPH